MPDQLSIERSQCFVFPISSGRVVANIFTKTLETKQKTEAWTYSTSAEHTQADS